MAQFGQGCSEKHGREMKMKDFKTLMKKATFPASFNDWSHQNGNLKVSKIVIIVLI